MSFYNPGWLDGREPNEGNIRQWLDNLYSKFQPIEQARWNQSNIDTLFYAGSQNFVNRYFGMMTTQGYQNFYFNLLQQPVNLITGYQRQHRKQINYIPSDNSDPATTDQYNKVISFICNTEDIHETFSKACEQSAIAGLVLLQPYLDFSGDDPAQGSVKLKLWEYNSFIIDPFCRDVANLTDCNYIWTQQYISQEEAKIRFPDKADKISPMNSGPQRYGRFYFLPEQYNMNRNNLLVLSYVWYRWKRKRKKLYSESKKQFFDIRENAQDVDMMLQQIPDLEIVETEVPTWRLAAILNEDLVYLGDNPMGFDDCPFIMVPWNYEPHINQYDLRVRSLVRTMRDSNYLMNRQIVISHDQKEATINAGWKRKSGAVANEDNMKKTGQGWDVIINEGYEMTDVEKIIPNAVPESDFALADRLKTLIFGTSGIDLENWSAQNDRNASALTTMLKQAANLTVLQKYFDQWDTALKVLGDRILKIVLNNWSAEKIALMINEEPTPLFYSGVFAKYQVQVQEGILTPTQANAQAQQLLEINQIFGREVFPPSMIIKNMNVANKAEVLNYLQNQEMQQGQMQQHNAMLESAFSEAKLQEMFTKAMGNLATARERHGRASANVGLLEERLSEISKNQSLSTKSKMESLEKLMDVIQRYGEMETNLKMSEIESLNFEEELRENRERQEAQSQNDANKFIQQLLSNMQGSPQGGMQSGMQGGMQG